MLGELKLRSSRCSWLGHPILPGPFQRQGPSREELEAGRTRDGCSEGEKEQQWLGLRCCAPRMGANPSVLFQFLHPRFSAFTCVVGSPDCVRVTCHWVNQPAALLPPYPVPHERLVQPDRAGLRTAAYRLSHCWGEEIFANEQQARSQRTT